MDVLEDKKGEDILLLVARTARTLQYPRIPGLPASIATVYDGQPLRRKLQNLIGRDPVHVFQLTHCFENHAGGSSCTCR